MSVLHILNKTGDLRLEFRPVEVPDALIEEIDLAFEHAIAEGAFRTAVQDDKMFAVKSDDEAGLINAELIREFPSAHQGKIAISRQIVGG